MNILVFSWRDPRHPLAGGAEQVMHEHMKGWVKVGHKVTLFSSRLNNLVTEEGIDGIDIVRQGYQYLGVQLAGFFYYLRNRKKFDLVVDQFHGLPFLTPLYVRKPKLAVIQEVAKAVWFLNPLPKPLNWIIGVIGYLGEPLVFLFYRKVHFMTGSHSAKEDVAKFGIPKKNITVVPHGVVIKKLKVKRKKSKVKTIVYLGILSKDKGIEDAIKCFSILHQKGNFIFWVIGKPETEKYGHQIKELVRKLKLSHKIKFWGFVSQEKKFKLLSKAHILINPSAHEGWGLVNIEANACGVPVVAYESAGLVDSIKNDYSGILCQVHTPEKLAEQVLSILQDEKKYEKMKNQAIKWSNRFSWRRSIDLSSQLIKNIINEF